MATTFLGINWPSEIEYSEDGEANIWLNIKKPFSNMQCNCAAFESWSILIKSIKPNAHIFLSFEEKSLAKMSTAEEFHYKRFLYRLYKFEKQMNWFKVSENNIDTLNKFKENFINCKKTNNPPNKKSNFNEKKGSEHIVEKIFVEFESVRKESGINFTLYDQLPNGLFKNEKSQKNRIFNTGYFDLWGIDNENSFNIFELKVEKNKGAGIISELYFYSNYAYDLLNDNDGFELFNSRTNTRGYNKLIELKNNKNEIKINAHFLTNGLHPKIDENNMKILEILNHNSNIQYSFISYNINPKLEYYKSKLNKKFGNSL